MKLSTFLIFSLSLLLSSCIWQKRIDKVSDTFLEGRNLSERIENLPFDHSWISPDVKASDYEDIFIAPVRTDLLKEDEWINSTSTVITSLKDYQYEARVLAKYFQRSLTNQVDFYTNNRFGIAKSKGKYVVVLEIAITELEFSKPLTRTASLLAPIPGTGPAVAAISDPHIAIAAKLTDGATGKLIATFADRRFTPVRIVDFNKLTATNSVKEICDLWAKEIATALQNGLEEKVESKKFTLDPL